MGDNIGISIGWSIFLALIVAILARRKNRNAWAWSLPTLALCFLSDLTVPYSGGFPLLAILTILAFKPPLCPECGQELSSQDWKSRSCPRCGEINAETQTA